jgi:DNA (cytosine-5)-methyltransferase 1
MQVEATYVPVAFSCKDHGADAGHISPTLRSMGHDGSHANAGGQVAVASSMAVRRLLPVECEKLQGFPRGWTDIPYRGKPAADGPRYRALGNSMAVPVVRWLGERIQMVDDLMREIAARNAA